MKIFDRLGYIAKQAAMKNKILVAVFFVVIILQLNGVWIFKRYWTSEMLQTVKLKERINDEQQLTTFGDLREYELTTLYISQTTTSMDVIKDEVTTQPLTTEIPKKKNIMFLKTHKTASSAVQNVLLRYGLHHNLTFALPNNMHDFSYPNFVSTKTISHFKDIEEYNILCHHMRFKRSVVTELMPKQTTVYVSIVREPGSLFESSFTYFWPIVPSFQKIPQKEKDGCERYLNNAEKFVSESKSSTFSVLEKNPTFFDFGYNNRNEDDSYITSSIQEIDELFDLILVSDYFKESMILLSDIMGWELKDVACLTLNARTQNISDVEYHTRIRRKSRIWNKADAALFDHFNSTFWQKIEVFGLEKMRIEIEKLDATISNLTELCLEGNAVDLKYVKTADKIYKPRNVDVKSYNLKPGAEKIEICKQLIASENPFSAEIFKSQHQRILRNNKF